MSKEMTIEKIYPNTDGRVVEIQYFSQGGVVLWEQMERIICCAGIGQRVLEDDGSVNTLDTMEAVSIFIKRIWTDLSAIPQLYWWKRRDGLYSKVPYSDEMPLSFDDRVHPPFSPPWDRGNGVIHESI